LVWGPDGHLSWARHSALQPTAIQLDERVLRVYVGMRDDDGVGRVGYVDVAADDPSRVLAVSQEPVLDIGRPGAFDENGVVPCAVVRRGERIFLYYAGYMLGHKVRFIAFGGLAVSDAAGRRFTRMHEVPITDRVDGELYFRVIHCIFEEDGKWRAWYGAGSDYIPHGDRTLPVYDIRYMESPDGIAFPSTAGRRVLALEGGDEHRVGRPQVVKTADRYRMFYASGTKERPYTLGYAESPDGTQWTRMDDALGLQPSANGWDSRMMSYPNPIAVGDRFYLFYNGNEYGREGFGYAELLEW